MLYSIPAQAIADLTVRTTIRGSEGRVRVHLETTPEAAGIARFTLTGHGSEIKGEAPIANAGAEAELIVPKAALWAPGQPNMYQLHTELVRSGAVTDRFR